MREQHGNIKESLHIESDAISPSAEAAKQIHIDY